MLALGLGTWPCRKQDHVCERCCVLERGRFSCAQFLSPGRARVLMEGTAPGLHRQHPVQRSGLFGFQGGPCRPPMHPVVLQTASQDLTLAGHHFLWETTVWIHSMHACMTFLPKLQVPKEPLQRLYQCPSQHILPPPLRPPCIDGRACVQSLSLTSVNLLDVLHNWTVNAASRAQTRTLSRGFETPV